MAVRNQEARDALKTYFKTFDIAKFPSKNVPTACLCLKAVAQALGENDLPTNLVHKVLEGFAKSSTKSLNEFCTSQIALRCGSFYQTLMKNTSLQNQLNDVLNNLETSYLDLVGEKLWAGVNSSPQGSAFIAGSGYNYEVEHAKAMAAMKNMPWEELVKLYAKCHHCGEKGHIHPDCPKYLQQIKSGKIIHGPKHQRPGPRGPPLYCPLGPGPPSSRPPGCAAPRRDFMKELKA
jgi:hypothetical protein